MCQERTHHRGINGGSHVDPHPLNRAHETVDLGSGQIGGKEHGGADSVREALRLLQPI